jgi:hypothetical protein
MGLGVEVTLGYVAVPPETMWETLRATHLALLPDMKRVDLYGTMHAAGDMARAITTEGRPHFLAEFSEGQVRYGPVGNPSLSQVFIKGCVEDIEDAWTWIRPVSQLDAFRAARVYDIEYEFWQNATDPIQYRCRNRSYAGLPMKSNGLPYPLEQLIIDTSGNPGRRVFREGYIEAIGAVMWLGEQFWDLTAANKCHVLNSFACEECARGVLRIQAGDTPFTSAEGAERGLQESLRAILFPKAGAMST